ncbi:hypothetical protein [Bordetella genomosp. 13]|uniref:Uncharacterized protein n=1 Tax=Bordetella genomosp. 13 TaxID=463040 RepID=A0A1W6Z8J8_9BORD|nr:hypothetical protein [Bordetella genomosp. 13]ARP93154.1 hypothetical protein CAL15_01385 [Bordetella genomosp. 13]
MKKIAALLFVLAAAPAYAKLPPPTPEAKAKADEAAAKAAWTAKVDAFHLCQAQDRVAAVYYAQAQASGKPTRPPMKSTACQDPGPFSYTKPQEKPLETSGAHSPAGTASSPPSDIKPHAEQAPAKP